jgi:hypothetical protein
VVPLIDEDSGMDAGPSGEANEPVFRSDTPTFFVLTGAITALGAVNAFWPRWAVEKVVLLPFNEDYTTILHEGKQHNQTLERETMIKTHDITHIARSTTRACGGWTLLIAAAMLASVAPVIAQNGPSAELQQKVAAVKQSVAENQQKLHQYQWTETTQLALKGDAKPPSQAACQYGPDGKVQKTPLGPPPAPPSGGRMKQKVVANKKEEMQDYMGQVKTLLAMYVPPDPQRMQQAFQSGKASLIPNSGVVQIAFKDYAQPGDQFTISFNSATKKVSSVNVNTYMDNPKDVVTLAIQFDSLQDGTNYVQKTVLDATAKKLVVTTTNSGYGPLGAH